MSESVLFEGYDDPPPLPSAEPGLSADRRRTLRQTEQIRAGIHPLTGRPLHEFGDRFARATDAKDLAFRCGSCIFRSVFKYHDRSYPKCTWTGSLGADDVERWGINVLPQVSHGAATDVRAWWPACRNYSAGDTSLSPDAARSIPPPTPADMTPAESQEEAP